MSSGSTGEEDREFLSIVSVSPPNTLPVGCDVKSSKYYVLKSITKDVPEFANLEKAHKERKKKSERAKIVIEKKGQKRENRDKGGVLSYSISVELIK